VEAALDCQFSVKAALLDPGTMIVSGCSQITEVVMKVGEMCRRAVIAVDNNLNLNAAAETMRTHHVGLLVVYRAGDELRRPIGVLTDRDIVIEVIAKNVDPSSVTVDDVMTRQPMVAEETEQLSDVLQAMRIAGIRRVPVVDARGALAGVVAIDDAFEVITGFMCDITGSIKSEQRHERRAR
jgi:predicted transcriptional regulator